MFGQLCFVLLSTGGPAEIFWKASRVMFGHLKHNCH